MSNVAWPSVLPNPSVSDYGYDPTDQTVRTDMESGTPRVRRRTTSTHSTFSVSWMMDGAELALFEGWHQHVINGGVAWFDVTLKTGNGLQTHEARFVGPYAAKALSPGNRFWTVTAKLETEDRKPMAEEDVYIAIYGEAEILEASEILDTFVNVTYPAI